jgi:drug/metabolite transporter (DMT)-like permease
MAAGAGVCFASLMLLFRALSKTKPDLSSLPITSLGSTLAIFVGLGLSGGDVWFSDPRSAAPLLFVDGGVLIASAMLVYAASPKHLTAAEVTLICLLEPALGPVWVYIGIGEAPSVTSVAAGVAFIGCLVVHEGYGMREAAREAQWKERGEGIEQL